MARATKINLHHKAVAFLIFATFQDLAEAPPSCPAWLEKSPVVGILFWAHYKHLNDNLCRLCQKRGKFEAWFCRRNPCLQYFIDPLKFSSCNLLQHVPVCCHKYIYFLDTTLWVRQLVHSSMELVQLLKQWETKLLNHGRRPIGQTKTMF